MSVVGRRRTLWFTKLWLGAALGVSSCATYFTLQRHPLTEPGTLPLTWLDEAAGFSPRWAWVYRSVYPLMTAGWLGDRLAWRPA